MYNGDRARKTTLVEYGFRLPSALDNRPLKFEEFQQRMRQTVFVSATPGNFERERSGQIVEILGAVRHGKNFILRNLKAVSLARTEVCDTCFFLPHILRIA